MLAPASILTSAFAFVLTTKGQAELFSSDFFLLLFHLAI